MLIVAASGVRLRRRRRECSGCDEAGGLGCGERGGVRGDTSMRPGQSIIVVGIAFWFSGSLALLPLFMNCASRPFAFPLVSKRRTRRAGRNGISEWKQEVGDVGEGTTTAQDLVAVQASTMPVVLCPAFEPWAHFMDARTLA